jgi:hypothetical protein
MMLHACGGAVSRRTIKPHLGGATPGAWTGDATGGQPLKGHPAVADTGAVADGQTANDRNDPPRVAPSDFRATPRALSGGTKIGELHVCPTCESELVYPVDWAPARRESWSVDLRCPDCEWHGGGVYAQEIVDRFDEELDRGTDQLLADLNLLTRANMEEQLTRFVDAIQRGQILPEDF